MRVGATLVLLGLVAGAPAQAAGSVADQVVRLEYTATHWSGSPIANLQGTEPSPTADVLYHMGFWYRVDGDTREYPLPPPDTETYTDGELVAHWANLDGKGFEVSETTNVFDNEAPSGGIWSELSVVNNNLVARTFTIFHYVDLDVAGTFIGDSATQLASNYLKFTDVSDPSAVMRYRATFATHFQVGSPFALRSALEDSSIDELSDAGLPFEFGDVAAAFGRTYAMNASGETNSTFTFPVSVSSRLPSDHQKGSYVNLSTFPALLWRTSLGLTGGRLMRRTAMFDGYGVNPPPGFELVATNSFYGAYRDDALYRNPTTGETRVFVVPISGAPSPNWVVAATADFDHDGKADILWRNLTSQRLVVWRMDGATRLGTITPDPDHAVDANWQVAGVDDFDRDGNQDLLFYNQSSGRLVIWRMDAAVHRITGSFTNPASVGSNLWKAVAVGDFGRGAGGIVDAADIVWQNDVSRKLVVWHMDHAGNRTSGVFTTPDTIFSSNYAVIGPR